jgi:hypothetical protein
VVHGKPWSFEEEQKLRALISAGTSLQLMGEELGKSWDGVRQKALDLGLALKVQTSREITCTSSSSSSFETPVELLSIEEALKVLVGALEQLKKPGLRPSEVSRLKCIIQGIKTYQQGYADFVNYREIEKRMEILEKKIESQAAERRLDAGKLDAKKTGSGDIKTA